MVFQHVILHFNKYHEVSNILVIADQYLSPMRMPALCLVSGLFASKALRLSKHVFLKRKVLYFFHLYIVWGLILISTMVILAVLTQEDLLGVLKLWVKLLVVADNVLWYFLDLAAYYLLFYFTNAIPKGLMLCCALALYFWIVIAVEEQGNVAISIPKYSLFFLVGAYFSQYIIHIFEKYRVFLFTACSLIYSALFCINKWYFSSNFLVFLISFIGLVAFISFCVVIDGNKVSMGIKKIGVETLPIYAMHWGLIGIFMVFLSSLVIEGFWWSIAIVVFTGVLVGLSIGIKRLTEKKLPALYGLPKYL